MDELRPKLSIGIAGCGIAGLASALLLSRQGHTVCLFDRFLEPEPVGSGLMLQPTGMAVLDQLGLASLAVERGAPIDGLLGLNEDGRTALKARYADLGKPSCLGIGIHRSSLFGILLDAVRMTDVDIRTGFDIASADLSHGKQRLIATDGQASPPFDLIIDSAGLNSPLVPGGFDHLHFGALWANVDLPKESPFNHRLLEQRYRAARQMVGILPIGKRNAGSAPEAAFFWSLAGSEIEKWKAAPLDNWKADVLDLWPETEAVLDQITSHDDLTFARYAHRTLAQPVGDRIIHIGDAWHSASPQLGQGANMALLDAWSLARGLEEGTTIHDGLRLAVGWRSDHVKLYQIITAFFTPLFQSEAAFPAALRDQITAPLSKFWPVKNIQSMLVAGLFGAPLQQLGLNIPDYSALTSAAEIAS